MAINEDFARTFSPLLHYLRKMELELTCPTCFHLLKVPTLLPCDHIFCRDCIKIEDQQQFDCPACGLSYLCGDLKHSVHIEAMVNIFKSMDIVIDAAVQRLDSQVTSGVITVDMKVDSKDNPILCPIDPKDKLEGSQINALGENVPSAGSNGSSHHERQVDISENPSKESPSIKKAADGELQGSKFGKSGVQVPLEGSPISNNSSKLILQVEEACNNIRRKLRESLYTYRAKVDGGTGEVANFGISKCGQSSTRLPVGISKKKDMEATKKEEKLIQGIDNSACQLDGDRTRESKRPKLESEHVIEMEIEEEIEVNIPSTSQINRFNLSGTTCTFGICSEWLICGSDLSTSQEDLLDKFARLTGASVSRTWKKCVTHVIGSIDRHGACRSSKKVLLAILSGQWVLNIDWVKACLEAKHPVTEEPYEISQITRDLIPQERSETSRGTREGHVGSNGPKKGRLRAMEKAPKIFFGLSFYFCNQFKLYDRSYYEELVIAAGGTVLEENNMFPIGSNGNSSPSASSYIVYNEDAPNTNNKKELIKIAEKRCDEVESLTAKTSFKVIGHLWLLDTIAKCNSANELDKGVLKTRKLMVS